MTVYVVINREQDYGGEIYGIYSDKPKALERLQTIRNTILEAELEEYAVDCDNTQTWENMK